MFALQECLILKTLLYSSSQKWPLFQSQYALLTKAEPIMKYFIITYFTQYLNSFFISARKFFSASGNWSSCRRPNILLQNCVNPVLTIGAHQYGMCCVCICYIEVCNVINCFVFVVVPFLKSEEAHVDVIEFWNMLMKTMLHEQMVLSLAVRS
jgi:hypothetical protein